MGDTIDNIGGGYRTLSYRDMAVQQALADLNRGPLDLLPPLPIYIIDHATSVETGINSGGFGVSGEPYEITVSGKVLKMLIAEMTPAERKFFATDPTWAKYTMRGHVLRRLLAAGKLRLEGMRLVVA